MRKIGLILRHEIVTALSRPGYLLFAFGIPLLGMLIFMVVTLTRGEEPVDDSGMVDQGNNELAVEGFVDHSGIIKIIPEDIPPDILLSFSDEGQALEALEAGDITAYYIIPEEPITSGEFIYVHPNKSPFSSRGQDWLMRWTLMVNMLDGDVELASRVWNPMDLKITNLDPAPEVDRYTEEDCSKPGYQCESNALVQMLPFGVVILFFVFTSISSGQLLTNITKEKQNRMMEVLMLSIDPREMLAGKIIGMGLVSLLQVAFWVVTMFIMLKQGGNTLNLPENFSIPATVLFWWLILFLFGYAITASLMGGIGALVPNTKAASQGSWLVLLPLMIGYFFAVTPLGQQDPHGLVSTLLSIFPLTAPVVMVMRVTIGNVPIWQLLLTILLMGGTVILIIRSVARMFRAQTLLSGQPFSTGRYIRALTGKI
jgi:ABC-2 type transport system permease protein